MIHSMTGYGKGEAQRDGLTITVEIKAVNHRFADISVKLPRSFMAFENDIRKQVGKPVRRGKVDVYVNYELAADAMAEPRLNRELARDYFRLLTELQQELGLLDSVSIEFIASQKDVLQVKDAELDDDAVQACLEEAVGTALEQLVAMRRVEGEETRKDIEARLAAAGKLLEDVEERAPQVPLEWQERLQERLAKLQQNVEWDPQRVAQEIAIFTDRCDISEEIARFNSHLGQFRDLLAGTEPIGRKMDFLVQEMNREVNTMGSKANDSVLTGLVVALKSELEKVREQVQNIE